VHRLLEELAAIPPLEWSAVLLALGYLVLAVRGSRWCWPFALLSSTAYAVLFASGALYMQVVLQVFYVAMAVYGWVSWTRADASPDPGRGVHRWDLRRHAVAVGGVLLLSAVSAAVLAGRTDAVAPYVDSLVTWGSVLATWMVARKVLENWLYWVALDSIAAGLYASQGFRATALLFLIYATVAVRGYVVWRRGLDA